MIFYISDLHFCHKNILRFDNRPFKDTTEMERILINNWNSRVTNEDTVYILGDFCWSRDVIKWKTLWYSLNGTKILIRGNHDYTQCVEKLVQMGVEVKNYLEIKDNGNTVILSHYPILCYKNDYNPNYFMLFGHVHATKEWEFIKDAIKTIRTNHFNINDNRGQCINVGCMMPWMNYTPRTLEELTKMLDSGIIYE